MSGIAFVTHPSVRIKGSENVYTPVQCVDQCPIGAPHMHCPFCVKTESYTDPVILKAHYRVKHVDKGIEFAGLKILRCCEHCDIVGVIKGEKKFKGAHWHCYRCRNGFNRRDEAIKHYKTHFRNPQTTFQISITQDLNSPVAYQQGQDAPRAGQQGATTIQASQQDTGLLATSEVIHPALTEAVSCISSPVTVTEQDISGNSVSLPNGKLHHDGTVHVSIESACETVDVRGDEGVEDGGGGGQQQAIIVIQEEPLDSHSCHQLDTSSFPAHIVNNEVSVVSEKENQETKGGNLAERVRVLEQDKVALNKEIQRLRKQVEKLEDTVRVCRKREEELQCRLQGASERGVEEALQRMESDHRSLLRQQLDTLHQVFLANRAASSSSSSSSTPPVPPPPPPSSQPSQASSTVLQLTDSNGQEIQVVSAACLEEFLASTVNSSSGAGGLPTTTIIQASGLSLEQITGSGAGTVVTTTEVPVSSSSHAQLTNYVMCVKREMDDSEEEEKKAREEEGGGGEEGCTNNSQTTALTLKDSEIVVVEPPPAKKQKTK